MNRPFFSIVIPTCNRPHDLKRCLTELVPQLAPAEDFEILICDDGKNSETRMMVEKEFPVATWHQGPRRGPASNRNLGAKLAQGNWIIFLDDDCLPSSTLVSTYRERAKALGPNSQVILEGPTLRIGEPDSLLWEAPHTPNGGVLISCNFAIARQTFWDLGAFDERFPHAAFEDTEFAARANVMGVTVEFLPKAAVQHPLRPLPNPRKLANRWEARVISSYDFGAKPWQVMVYLPRHVLLVIISRFRKQKRSFSNFKAMLIFATEFLMFLQKLPFWCRHYKRVPRSSFWSQPAQASAIPRRFGL